METNEFSFILKPSSYGIGVFAMHDISQGTYLRLFGNESRYNDGSMIRKKEDVPEYFHQLCIDRGDMLMCPEDFGHMHVGWYLNHSNNPNAIHDKDYKWYASRDIKAGEEITIEYNTLEEPEDAKDPYYKGNI